MNSIGFAEKFSVQPIIPSKQISNIWSDIWEVISAETISTPLHRLTQSEMVCWEYSSVGHNLFIKKTRMIIQRNSDYFMSAETAAYGGYSGIEAFIYYVSSKFHFWEPIVIFF